MSEANARADLGEDRLTSDDQTVRLTHIIVPSLAQPRKPHTLITPETTDISDLSDLSAPSDTDSYAESDAETEMGDNEGDVTFTPEFVESFTRLERMPSNTSSTYASSEGGSEFGMADSMTLPPPPTGDWRIVSFSDTESDVDDAPRVGVPRSAPAFADTKSWEEKPTFFEYLYGS